MERRDVPTYGAIDPVSVMVVNPSSNSQVAQGFRQAEFLSLCDTVSSSIYVIQSNASSLERAQKQVGTPSDNQSLRDRIHNTQQKTNKTVGITTQQLRQATNLAKVGSKQHRFQVDRLHNEFRGTVERYSALQKQIADRIKSVLLRPTRSEPMSRASDWPADADDRTNLMNEEEESRRQGQEQLTVDLEMEHALMQEREQRIRQIEADVLDVNEIFRDLAAMVVEQGDVINTIEGNIENVAANAEGGAEQLSKALSYQQKYRKKLCILLVILLVVAVAIIIIVVVTQTK